MKTRSRKTKKNKQKESTRHQLERVTRCGSCKYHHDSTCDFHKITCYKVEVSCYKYELGEGNEFYKNRSACN